MRILLKRVGCHPHQAFKPARRPLHAEGRCAGLHPAEHVSRRVARALDQVTRVAEFPAVLLELVLIDQFDVSALRCVPDDDVEVQVDRRCGSPSHRGGVQMST